MADIEKEARSREGWRQDHVGRWEFWPLKLLAHLTVIAAATVPLWFVLMPPLKDYPNHLARTHIAREIERSAVLQQYYLVDWSLIPNLGLDVLLYVLTAALPIYTAATVAVALNFVIWVTAASLLHFAIFKRWSYWPLFAVFFLYNANLAWGFVNYLLSTGLCLLAFAVWILLEERSRALRWLFLIVAPLVVFLGHLIAYGTFGLLMLCYQAHRLLRDGEFSSGRLWSLIVAPGLALAWPFFLLFLHTPAHGPLKTEYGGLLRKTEAFLSPTLQYLPTADVILWSVLAIVLLACLATRRARLSAVTGWPLVGVFVVAVAAPTMFLGNDYSDLRLPTVFCVLLFAGSQFRGRHPIESAFIVGIFIALLMLRLVSINQVWLGYDQDYREFIAASQKLPEGARVITAYGETYEGGFSGSLKADIASLAVLERQVFLPNLYTGAHNLRVRDAYRSLDTPQTAPAPIGWLLAAKAHAEGRTAEYPRSLPMYLKNWFTKFDYLVVFLTNPEAFKPPPYLTPLARGGYFVICRIEG